jgi:dTDP-4-dehydrorhamnose 3,5-epimerase
MIEKIRKESAKKVITKDTSGAENGFLVELYKDGPKTTVYLTAAKPGAFKGYHLHNVRASHYVCIRGKMKITVYENPEKSEKPVPKVEHILDANNPERLWLPTDVYIGLQNIGDEEAWMINFPEPAYDPSLSGEQLDMSPEQIEDRT